MFLEVHGLMAPGVILSQHQGEETKEVEERPIMPVSNMPYGRDTFLAT